MSKKTDGSDSSPTIFLSCFFACRRSTYHVLRRCVVGCVIVGPPQGRPPFFPRLTCMPFIQYYLLMLLFVVTAVVVVVVVAVVLLLLLLLKHKNALQPTLTDDAESRVPTPGERRDRCVRKVLKWLSQKVCTVPGKIHSERTTGGGCGESGSGERGAVFGPLCYALFSRPRNRPARRGGSTSRWCIIFEK